jgi:hypothetical protein
MTRLSLRDQLEKGGQQISRLSPLIMTHGYFADMYISLEGHTS